MNTEKQPERLVGDLDGMLGALDEHALVSITDATGKITHVNDKYCAISQFARKELIGQRQSFGSTQHAPNEFRPNLWSTLAQGQTWHGDIRNLAKDGSPYWMTATIVPTLDEEGRPTRFVFIQTDMTRRHRDCEKLAETVEHLRALLGRLQRAREHEGILQSQELHDNVAQLLAGVKANLQELEAKVGEAAPASLPMQATTALVDRAIAAVKKLAAELAPGALPQLGLAAALLQELRLQQERGELHCVARVAEPVPALPPEVAGDLFCICQAALSNVVRHARATRVELRLHAAGGAVFLEVSDDGVGIDPQKEQAPQSLGLLGMKERAARCGGTLAFTRNVPHGTRLIVRIPHVTTMGNGLSG